MKEKIAVLTSGGDAPGMNAAIRAVVRKDIYHGYEVYGVEQGYEGVINGRFIPMNLSSVAGVIQHGGTMLRTARSERFKIMEGFNSAVQQLHNSNIKHLVVIGSDGSMAGAAKLGAAGINTMVIPATIDNDMSGTDYAIGFDTALNTVLEAVNKIRDTAVSHQRVAVVEVMGRHAGHIALMAGLACGAEAILLPEKTLDIEEVCSKLTQSHQRGKLYSIVMVAEGVGKVYDIAAAINKRTNFDPHVTVLGYIQRGGNPSAVDNINASKMGALAVDSIEKNEYNRLVAMKQGNLVTVPIDIAMQDRRGINFSIYELADILAI